MVSLEKNVINPENKEEKMKEEIKKRQKRDMRMRIRLPAEGGLNKAQEWRHNHIKVLRELGFNGKG